MGCCTTGCCGTSSFPSTTWRSSRRTTSNGTRPSGMPTRPNSTCEEIRTTPTWPLRKRWPSTLWVGNDDCSFKRNEYRRDHHDQAGSAEHDQRHSPTNHNCCRAPTRPSGSPRHCWPRRMSPLKAAPSQTREVWQDKHGLWASTSLPRTPCSGESSRRNEPRATTRHKPRSTDCSASAIGRRQPTCSTGSRERVAIGIRDRRARVITRGLDQDAARGLERAAVTAFFKGDYQAALGQFARMSPSEITPRVLFYQACTNAALALVEGPAGAPRLTRARAPARSDPKRNTFERHRRYVSPQIISALEQ